MIQPVSAFSPRAGFRGSKQSYGVSPKRTRSEVALMNAAGTSLLAGGVTAAIARSYTPSWGQAGVLGLFGMILAMFFIAPPLVGNTNLLKSKKNSAISGADSGMTGIKSTVKPVKKLVQFRQS